jgi:hypothetical protein
MHGHSENEPLSNVLWPDAEILSVHIDYHAVTLRIRETSGLERTVRCGGHIGYQLIGLWDEVVVESARLVREDPFLDDCLSAIRVAHGAPPPTTGDPARNRQSWRLLSIQLADGAVLRVAAADFVAENSSIAT